MQEFKNNELTRTQRLEDNILPAMSKDSTHQVIGKIPDKDVKFKLNGLLFEVISSDFVRGRFVAKICKP